MIDQSKTKAQLIAELEERNRQLMALHEIGHRLTATLDLQEIYRVMYREVAQRLLNAPHFVVALFDHVTQTIFCDFAVVNAQEINAALFPRISLGEGLMSSAVRSRMPYILKSSEIAALAESGFCNDHFGRPGIPQSVMYVPLVSGDKVVGIMDVQHDDRDAFRYADVTLLAILAGQAAVAMENAKLFAKVQSYATELEQRVAERHRVEEALRESEQRFRLVISSISDHIYVTEVTEAGQHINIYLSPHVEPLTGYSWDTFMADWRFWPSTVIHPDDRAEASIQAEQLAQGHSSEVEYRLVRADGKVIWVRDSARVQKEGGSNIVYGVVSDITERKRVELERAWLTSELRDVNQTLDERVRARTAELQAILDAVGEGIVVTDRHGVIQYLNPALERLTGYSEADTLGQTPRLWRSDRHSRAVYNQMWQTIRAGQTWQGELVNRRKDGRLYDVLLTITPILGPDSQPLGFVGAQHDITPFKEMDRLKSEFISTAAHELRTPLTSIQGFSEILLTRELPPDRQERFLTFINNQAQALAAIIEDLLDLSRLEAGQSFETAKVSVNLKEVVSEALFGFRENNPQHDYQVVGSEPWPVIQGDPAKLSQLFKNLISNATKYSPEGGEVTVQAEHKSQVQLLYITVADQGIGMSSEQLEHIFDRFYRADASNTAIGGTGLGMAISEVIVERHRGKIWVESKYGAGTTVHVLLPLPERPRYVLIIEDEEGLRRLQQISLEMAGFTVLTAEKGETGLELARSCLPDLILLDLNLPEMSGFIVLEHLQANRLTKNIPVIITSALDQPEEIERAINRGAADYLVKPYSMGDLAIRINRALTETQREVSF